MRAGPSGSTATGPSIFSAPRRSPNERSPAARPSASADDDHVLEVGQAVAHGRQIRQVVTLPDARHHDQCPRPALAQDETDLLGPVEVHDGDEGDPEHGAGVEGDGGLHPVGQLEGDDVARAEPERAQAGGHPQGLVVDVADRPEVGVRGRPDPEAPRRVLEQRVAEELAQGAVVPGALGPVALGQVRRHRAELEAAHADSMKSDASRWRCAPAPPKRSSFCFTRLKRKWASLAHVKPTPPCSWMSSPVTRTPASAA